MKMFVFAPDDFTLAQPCDEPGAVDNLARFLFNVAPRCCTFMVHNGGRYLIPEVRSRSTGYKCTGCGVTVRRGLLLKKRVYSCHCSTGVLGHKATPFSETEWHQYRSNSLLRNIPIRAEMEGGLDGGKN